MLYFHHRQSFYKESFIMPVFPITPGEASEQKNQAIPDAVIEAFNELIIQTLSFGRARFTQEKVVELIVAKGIKKGDIFTNNWLDIEPLYEDIGWKVTYDKPGFNETYEATFTFDKKK